MSPARSSVADLGNLLDAAADAVYVLDERRRIVFVNAACRNWIGPQADDVLGQECRYHSNPDEHGQVPPSGLLCPPPEVFGGARMRATVILVDESGQPHSRQVDFIPLSGENDEVAAVLAMAMSSTPVGEPEEPRAELSPAELHVRLQQQRQARQQRYEVGRLVGQVPAIQRVRAQVRLAAGTTARVLVWGPAGSGRQHAAKAIHYARPFETLGPLVPLACELLGAELLQASIRGLARAKEPGSAERVATLLLTHVDEMPAEAQAELAGFLRLTDLPVRIISTARQPLMELAADGRFPYDLACLLSTLEIELPSLTERLDDLPLLAQHFLELANLHRPKQLGGFAADALDALTAYPWPGQVAELATMVAEAHAAAEGPQVQVRDLPPRIGLSSEAARHVRRADESIVLEHFLAEIERELIERALVRAKGNKTKAARLLGMTRPRFYRRLVQLGMEDEAALEGDHPA